MSAGNNWHGVGRLTSDPKVTYTQGTNPMCIANFNLAVNRKFAKQGQQQADFVPCKAFGKVGEIVERYLRKGMKVIVNGEIHTNQYTNRDGQKVYGWEVNIIDFDFAESKSSQQNSNQGPVAQPNNQYAPPGGGYNAPPQNYAPQPQAAPQRTTPPPAPAPVTDMPEALDGFMSIPDGIDENLPFG